MITITTYHAQETLRLLKSLAAHQERLIKDLQSDGKSAQRVKADHTNTKYLMQVLDDAIREEERRS